MLKKSLIILGIVVGLSQVSWAKSTDRVDMDNSAYTEEVFEVQTSDDLVGCLHSRFTSNLDCIQKYGLVESEINELERTYKFVRDERPGAIQAR